MKCQKCGGEEFYKAYWDKGESEEAFLVCSKCRARYPLQDTDKTAKEA